MNSDVLVLDKERNDTAAGIRTCAGAGCLEGWKAAGELTLADLSGGRPDLLYPEHAV